MTTPNRGVTLLMKELTEITIKESMRIFQQPTPPMNILRPETQDPSYEFEWPSVQRRRLSGDPLMLGGRAINLTPEQKERQRLARKGNYTNGREPKGEMR